MCYQIMGLGIFENRRLPPSSRLHESEMWQSLCILEIEMVRVLRGETGRLGSATGRNLVAVKGLQWCFYYWMAECDLEDHARVREL
jgi:hypothetical protein